MNWLLSLSAPVVPAAIVELPDPIQARVDVGVSPTRTVFLITLFVAPKPSPSDCNQTTAVALAVFVLVMVRFLLAVDSGQTVLAVEPEEPSIVM